MKLINKPSFEGIVLDSEGELHFAWWLQELKEYGYIDSFYKGEAIKLSDGYYRNYTVKTALKTKVKIENKEQCILHHKIYTPDWIIYWTEKGREIFCDLIRENTKQTKLFLCDLVSEHLPVSLYVSYVECKPDFDQNSRLSLFEVNRKWVWHDKKIFVNLVKTPSFFESSFYPEKYLNEKTEVWHNNRNKKNLPEPNLLLKYINM